MGRGPCRVLSALSLSFSQSHCLSRLFLVRVVGPCLVLAALDGGHLRLHRVKRLPQLRRSVLPDGWVDGWVGGWEGMGAVISLRQRCSPAAGSRAAVEAGARAQPPYASVGGRVGARGSESETWTEALRAPVGIRLGKAV